LLLREAMDRAESPNQLAAIHADDDVLLQMLLQDCDRRSIAIALAEGWNE
jgi:hypothetical protein